MSKRWAGRPFAERVETLPRLGLGVSTEFGAFGDGTGLDVIALHERHPNWAAFLEVGVDLARGLDPVALAWSDRAWPTTYHFLDLNLESDASLEEAWLVGAAEHCETLSARWLCGDAGLWYLGRRDRGHGTLMPPILCEESAQRMAAQVRSLREVTGLEVLPENPPAHLYLGDLDLLDYFARVAEAADSGLLLDVAHLAIYQRTRGRAPTDGLDSFPLDRVVEIHVAGGSVFRHDGKTFVDDDHSPEPLPDTWEILGAVLPRTPFLRALVYECERNPLDAVAANFARLEQLTTGRFA